ncbi:MAG: glycosyltransferase family 2 protein, partial [Candidatus Binatia bacterium]
MKVAICALTFRRNDGLRRLLEGIARLELDGDGPDIRVVVVDNDPDEGARPVCTSAPDGLRWPVEYHHEPRRGIAHGRNRAVGVARRGSDWIAFIDDDEVPRPRWLKALLEVQRRTDADVVTGPVVPHFPEPVPDWVTRFGFFERRRHADGAPIDRAFTNNVLFRATLLGADEAPFDVRFALTGGEDVHFFRRLREAGRRIHWADEAEVVEWIPASRACANWLTRRMYRVGTSTALAELDLFPGGGRRLRLAARALAWTGIGLALLPAALA